jgi:DNA-binding PadR family transcriptional regulator
MVLALLSERPMHPYEMQRLMIARGDDKVVRVQRGSLYPAVERLVAAGLVEHEATVRAGRRPERTVYRITDEGAEVARTWLLDMLSVHKNEYPEFGAALSFGALVDSTTFAAAIRRRRDQLAGELEESSAVVKHLTDGLPRVFILENEFVIAMRRAELDFLDGIVADIDEGRLAWDAERIAAWYADVVAAGHFPEAVSRPLDQAEDGEAPEN